MTPDEYITAVEMGYVLFVLTGIIGIAVLLVVGLFGLC